MPFRQFASTACPSARVIQRSRQSGRGQLVRRLTRSQPVGGRPVEGPRYVFLLRPGPRYPPYPPYSDSIAVDAML